MRSKKKCASSCFRILMSLMIPMFLMSLRTRVLYALTILVDGPYARIFLCSYDSYVLMSLMFLMLL